MKEMRMVKNGGTDMRSLRVRGTVHGCSHKVSS